VSQKKEDRIVVVLSLGRGYRVDDSNELVDICSAGKQRADVAYRIAIALETAGETVYLAATAGREHSRKDGPTMAILTKRYWYNLDSSMAVIANHSEYAVWGTLAELEWLERYIHHHFPNRYVRVIVVAAPRQDVRVQRMQATFGFVRSLRMETQTTNEAPIPRYHEFLAYTKLLLFAIGLRRPADWIRRVTAVPIRE
jgi:hypothetical protein